MSEYVHNFTQLIQSVDVDELRTQCIIQNGSQGVHEGGKAGPFRVCPWEEMVKQLMLILAHLQSVQQQ
jgi:hypothetical protein